MGAVDKVSRQPLPQVSQNNTTPNLTIEPDLPGTNDTFEYRDPDLHGAEPATILRFKIRAALFLNTLRRKALIKLRQWSEKLKKLPQIPIAGQFTDHKEQVDIALLPHREALSGVYSLPNNQKIGIVTTDGHFYRYKDPTVYDIFNNPHIKLKTPHVHIGTSKTSLKEAFNTKVKQGWTIPWIRQKINNQQSLTGKGIISQKRKWLPRWKP